MDLHAAPPRSREVCARVVAKHASWWGFVVYGVLYALSVMAIGYAFASGVFEMIAHKIRGGPTIVPLPTSWWIAIAIAGAATSGPITSRPFVRWVRRRRAQFARVARDGEVRLAEVVAMSGFNVSGLFDLLNGSSPTTSKTLRIRAGDDDFTAKVPGTLPWARPGMGVEVISLPDARYALVIAPGGKDFAARRK